MTTKTVSIALASALAVAGFSASAGAMPLSAGTAVNATTEAPVVQVRDGRRAAIIGGAVALGAVGAIAAANSRPYGGYYYDGYAAAPAPVYVYDDGPRYYDEGYAYSYDYAPAPRYYYPGSRRSMNGTFDPARNNSDK